VAQTKQWKPKRNRSEDDRNRGSAGFIDLSEGENFLGYALFHGDPKKDEPGYYEFQQHWVTSGRGQSVPCAGDDCPYCEEGDKPRDVAYTAWLVLKDPRGTTLNNGDGEVLSFRANSLVIKQITEMIGEDESPKGVQFRMSRLDDRGNYVMSAKPKKALTATQIKELLKESGIDYDGMVTNRLRKAMEGLSVARALDEDDDDDVPTPKRNGGKATSKGAGKKAAPEADEWPAKSGGEQVVVDSVDEDGNFVMVTADVYDGAAKVWTTPDIEFNLEDLEEGQEIAIAYMTDSDGDFVLRAEPELMGEPEGEPEPEENDLPDELEDEEFDVVSIDKQNSTIDVKSDSLDLEFTLYFLDRGPASKVDFDDYEEGNTIVVSAEKDTVGDMVATAIPSVKEEAAKPAARGRKTAGTKGRGK
jgi:ribosomal protein L12E/L44/L45/RPP1/RPP2